MANSQAGPQRRSFFAEGSPFLRHGLLTDTRTAAEVDRIESLVGPWRGPVLDIGCGFGRHLIELSRRGIDARGFDPSEAMVAAAHRKAGASGHLIAAEATTAPAFAANPDHRRAFGLGLCLFTTLGQLDPDVDNAAAGEAESTASALLEATAELLAPGAALVIEVPDRSRAVAALVANEHLGEAEVFRSFDAASGTLRERFVVSGPDPVEYQLAYQLFSEGELRALVVAAGFGVEAVIGSGLVEPPLTNMTIVARR